MTEITIASIVKQRRRRVSSHDRIVHAHSIPKRPRVPWGPSYKSLVVFVNTLIKCQNYSAAPAVRPSDSHDARHLVRRMVDVVVETRHKACDDRIAGLRFRWARHTHWNGCMDTRGDRMLVSVCELHTCTEMHTHAHTHAHTRTHTPSPWSRRTIRIRE